MPYHKEVKIKTPYGTQFVYADQILTFTPFFYTICVNLLITSKSWSTVNFHVKGSVYENEETITFDQLFFLLTVMA